MSLKKKIIFSFVLSSSIIAILFATAYINFFEIKREIRYLELSDTIRSESLQLRRHEKNFFLYRDLKEIESIRRYLDGLRSVLEENRAVDDERKLLELEEKVETYEKIFNQIESITWGLENQINGYRESVPQHEMFFPLIETSFLERPLINAALLSKMFPEDSVHSVKLLQELDARINALRKVGEEMIDISKEIDISARTKVNDTINVFQNTALVMFFLFFVVGLGTLFVVSHNIASRIKTLTDAVEKTGKGHFSPLAVPPGKDEVSILIEAFNRMEKNLVDREDDLRKKNEELLQSRKLASIGTLASGVAHELNNPLNNIYLAAQILSKEVTEDSPKIIKETVSDIFSQSLRVKRIVSDLLEFARGTEPELEEVSLSRVIGDVIRRMEFSGELANIKTMVSAERDIVINADRHLLEQVFINLFSNAADAMKGKGTLDVSLAEKESSMEIRVADTGEGISPEDISKVFDPFFTTKEKGTGLGLAIVYSIIVKHKGEIRVESEKNKGTAFIITFPRR